MDDAAHKIVNDGPQVLVYGAAQTSSIEWDYALVSYDKGNGNQQNVTVNTGSGLSLDKVTDISRDQTGNIYVVGGNATLTTGFDYYVAKYDTTLTYVWSQSYNGSDNLDDIATSVKVDGSGNVFITGYSTTAAQDRNYVTLKYNSSGTQQWVASYNGVGNGADSAAALALDGSGNIFVTGTSYNGSNLDYLTLKYNSSGTKQWEVAYTGIYGGDDRATNMAIDASSGIIVSGTSWNDTAYTYRTVKYVEVEMTEDQDTINNDRSWGFIRNNGQLLNTDTLAANEIKFYNPDAGNCALFFTDTSVSYVLIKTDTTSSTPSDSIHRVDMKFERGLHSKVSDIEKHDYFNNYYLPHLNKGRTQVPIYEKLLHRNVWYNTQIQYEGTATGMAYYIILEPGADTAKVKFKYSGADSIKVDALSGELLIFTSIDTIIQDKPRAWQITGSGTKVSVPWQPSYVVNGNEVSFTWGAYSTTDKLILAVVPPQVSIASTSNGNLWWSTFFGGSISNKQNFFYDIVLSDTSYSYVAGKSYDATFPVTTGAQQSFFSGTYDGVIVSFDNYAQRKWATFAGGTSKDEVSALAFNQNVSQSRIYFIGSTESAPIGNFSAKPAINPSNGSYWKNTNSGGFDAFIGRLNEVDGSFSWLSFYGGASDDFGKTITIDKYGDVFIAGNTSSTTASSNNCLATTNTNFPLCDLGNSAYYQSSNAGGQDIFLAKFDTTNSLKWSTFWGSSGNDIVHEIKYGKGPSHTGNDNVYIVGRTTRTPIPNTTYLFDGTPSSSGDFPFKDQTGTADYFHVSDGGIAGRFSLGGAPIWSTAFPNTFDFQTIGCRFEDFYCFGRRNDELIKVKFDKFDNSLEYSVVEPGDIPDESTNPFDGSYYHGESAINSKLIDATEDSLGNLYVTYPIMDNLNTLLSYPPGMYFQSTMFSDGIFPDFAIIAWDIMDFRFWATYFGESPSVSNSSLAYPIEANFSAGIVVDKAKSLYIVGYSGGAFPLFDASTNPTYPTNKTPWFNAGGGQTFHGTITRFDLEAIGLDVPEVISAPLKSMLVYPNPINNEFVVYSEEDLSSVRVYSLLGQIVHESTVTSSSQATIDCSKWTAGCYIVEGVVQGQPVRVKIIKQ